MLVPSLNRLRVSSLFEIASGLNKFSSGNGDFLGKLMLVSGQQALITGQDH